MENVLVVKPYAEEHKDCFLQNRFCVHCLQCVISNVSTQAAVHSKMSKMAQINYMI